MNKIIVFALCSLYVFSASAKEVLISLGHDAFSELSKEEMALSILGEDHQMIVTRVDEERLPEISALMHEKFHRCGGFIVHDSIEEAMENHSDKAELSFFDYSIDQQARVESMIKEVDQINIVQTIQKLSEFNNRYYRSQTGIESQKFVGQLWKSLAQNRNDASLELFEHKSWPQPSLILTIEGSELPNEIVVVGGHADSIAGWFMQTSNRAPGADDNASGIATITEAMRVLFNNNYRPKRTLKFMAYAAEEVGLRGSDEIAKSFRAAGKEVVGVLQLDMTNFQGSDHDIVMMGDFTSTEQNKFLGNLIDTYLQMKWGIGKCGYACSDHASWHRQGFPASIPFESYSNDMNRAIHTARDTIDRSNGNAVHAAKFARLAVAYILEMAK